MDESQSISVEDYFMGICFQPENKIAEYDGRVFVVHLPSLLNETNLSKRKRKHTVEYLLCISEAILLSLSVKNFFWSLLESLRPISSFAIKSLRTDKQSEKHASFISQISTDFASKFAKIELHKIKEFRKL